LKKNVRKKRTRKIRNKRTTSLTFSFASGTENAKKWQQKKLHQNAKCKLRGLLSANGAFKFFYFAAYAEGCGPRFTI